MVHLNIGLWEKFYIGWSGRLIVRSLCVIKKKGTFLEREKNGIREAILKNLNMGIA